MKTNSLSMNLVAADVRPHGPCSPESTRIGGSRRKEALTKYDLIRASSPRLPRHSGSKRLIIVARKIRASLRRLPPFKDSFRAGLLTFALIVTSLGLAQPSVGADSLSETLQKGLFEEEANHNLDAAIKAYQSVLQQTDRKRVV